MGMQDKVCGACKYHNSEQNICTNVKGYKTYASKCSGACPEFTKPNLFDKITESPEVLAPQFIYWDSHKYKFISTCVKTTAHETYEEAIEATLQKLKEPASDDYTESKAVG